MIGDVDLLHHKSGKTSLQVQHFAKFFGKLS